MTIHFITLSIDIDKFIAKYKAELSQVDGAQSLIDEINNAVIYLDFDQAFEKACDFIHLFDFDLSETPDYNSVFVSDFMDIYSNISEKQTEDNQ